MTGSPAITPRRRTVTSREAITIQASYIPSFSCGDEDIDRAYALAVRVLRDNVLPFRGGLLTKEEPCILAGKGYDKPWTRDAAINVWNGAGLLLPEASKNTLLSVLDRKEDGRILIGGQYWDAVIWAIGAWSYWLYTGDRDFLSFAAPVILDSLETFEKTEFDPALGLFRGPACYGDGVAAYPDRYVTCGSSILSFAKYAKDLCVPVGAGLPMFALSTNCLYYAAYRIASRLTGSEMYTKKAAALRDAVNKTFWDEARGTYAYLADPWGGCDAQESLGLCFALMFGIAGQDRARSVLEHAVVTPNGIPCVYPTFDRYLPCGFGRHSGTVWPHIQAFWAHAAGRLEPRFLEGEVRALTKNALRAGDFSEIFHPVTGLPYGGAQEAGDRIADDWVSQREQTWSATGYLHMLLFDLAGLTFREDSLLIAPIPVKGITRIRIGGLVWRDMEISLEMDLRDPSRPIRHVLPYAPSASVELNL